MVDYSEVTAKSRSLDSAEKRFAREDTAEGWCKETRKRSSGGRLGINSRGRSFGSAEKCFAQDDTAAGKRKRDTYAGEW